MNQERSSLLKASELVAQAKTITVLTGAGMSAESGIPTFRDALTGLWSQFKAEELATESAFLENPDRVWSWYQWRRRQVLAAQPNAGHHALADLASKKNRLVVVTQNVDGLHQRAGQLSVIELHGNILNSRCHLTGKRVDFDDWERDSAPPSSIHPEGLLRPCVVWFGESLPESTLRQAIRYVTQTDLLLSIGTSSVVQPAASLPLMALNAGIPVIEINPLATPLSPEVAVTIRGTAAKALPVICDIRSRSR